MDVVDRALRLCAGAIVAASLMGAVGMSAARAQQSQTLTVSAFLADPAQLLRQNPNGGSLLVSRIQQLALSDPATFKVLLGLLPIANDIQKGAIGQGLAQAAKIKVLTDQPTATEWQKQIAAITDPSFSTAATNAFGDVKLGAAGGGAAAGSGLGGPGGGSGGGGGAPEDIRSRTFPTQAFTFTSSTSGSSGSSGSSGTTGSSPFSSSSSSVSPSVQ